MFTAEDWQDPATRRPGTDHRPARLRNRRRRVLALLGATCLAAGLVLSANAGWMQAKAWLAQHLIAGAWAQTLDGESGVRPWPWADTWPVAKMTTPKGDDLYVLEGLTGHALAFGPGFMSASHMAGEPGTMVIAGHKDSHFRFLEELRTGDFIGVQTQDSSQWRYRVTGFHIADSREQRIVIDHQHDKLMLVTCYPFGASHYDSPWRYVVTAERV